MENSQKNCVVIPLKDYTPTLQQAMEDFRAETLDKMESLKQQFNLHSLDIAHAYSNKIWVHVNQNLVINYLEIKDSQ